MNYLKNNHSSTLFDIVLTKLAVQSCHNYQNLKTAILCFPKSTYADVFSQFSKDDILGSKKVWEDIIEIQAKTVCELMPLACWKSKLLTYIRRISIEWVIWARNHEQMFGLSRELCSNYINPGDWTEHGKLNKRKVAKRLVQDKSLDIFQRYEIACVYFLESFIPDLWQQMSELQKKYFFDSDNSDQVMELVKLWSYRMAGKVEKLIVNENRFWWYGLLYAVETGLIDSVAYCWKRLSCVDKILTPEIAFHVLDLWTEIKISSWMINMYDDCNTCILPRMYYNEILCFILSNMFKEQQIEFFAQSFQDENYTFVLDCFLEWPCQDFFLPTITQLWEDLPEYVYEEQLLNLTKKYTDKEKYDDYHSLNPEFDHQGLLLALWEETPERFKINLFSNQSESLGKEILLELFLKQPFNKKAIEVIRCILKYVSSKEKEEIFENIGDDIVLERGLNFFCFAVDVCFSEKERQMFKKHFILSESGHFACFLGICDGEEVHANLLIKWGMFTAEEVTEFKYNLIFEDDHIFAIGDLILCEKIASVEKVMSWCLPTGRFQLQFKKAVAESEGMRICVNFLKALKWIQLEQFLTWCFLSEEVIEQFKKNLFHSYGINIHSYFMSENYWKEAELLFEWFSLSPKDIMKFKTDTIFSNECTLEIHSMLFESAFDECYSGCGCNWKCLLLYLRWGLFDKKTVLSFKKIFVKNLQNLKLMRKFERILKCLMKSYVKDCQRLIVNWYHLSTKLKKLSKRIFPILRISLRV